MNPEICDHSHKGRELLPLDDARALMVSKARIVSRTAELRPLPECLGRILAQEVLLDRHEPPVRRSAMDGFALRTEDGMKTREIIGSVFAGTPNSPGLQPGQAVAVMTGGTVAENADAVIPVELTQSNHGVLKIKSECRPGQHIRLAGEMGAAGRQILERGIRLELGDLTAAAGCGVDPLQVYSRPAVTVISTGDEVVPWVERPGQHQVRDSNRLGAILQTTRVGGDVIQDLHVLDQPDALLQALQNARQDSDLVVTIGGVSMGEKDHLPSTFAAAGFVCLFHGVSVQPGKPVWVGQAENGTWAIGLPGNPVSSMAVFELLGRPLLEVMAGMPPQPEFSYEVGFLATKGSAKARVRFVLASLSQDDEGRTIVTPQQESGSGDWTSLAGARVLMKIPPRAKLESGDPVSFIRF
jgi:molybdopterin molybdotransferase